MQIYVNIQYLWMSNIAHFIMCMIAEIRSFKTFAYKEEKIKTLSVSVTWSAQFQFRCISTRGMNITLSFIIVVELQNLPQVFSWFEIWWLWKPYLTTWSPYCSNIRWYMLLSIWWFLLFLAYEFQSLCDKVTSLAPKIKTLWACMLSERMLQFLFPHDERFIGILLCPELADSPSVLDGRFTL